VRGRNAERGSAAVEFAMVVPLLIVMVLGIAEFGRIYHVQTTISGAAREGVRSMALTNDASTARSAAKTAASNLSPALSDSQISVTLSGGSTCTSTVTTNVTATVTISYPVTFLTSMFGTGVTLSGTGVMRCNG
jgi:Flp pilus assembly protein TadG